MSYNRAAELHRSCLAVHINSGRKKSALISPTRPLREYTLSSQGCSLTHSLVMLAERFDVSRQAALSWPAIMPVAVRED